MVLTFGRFRFPRNASNINLPKVGATYCRTDTVRLMGQRAWANLRTEIKTYSSLNVSRKQLKSKNASIATVGFAELLSMDY